MHILLLWFYPQSGHWHIVFSKSLSLTGESLLCSKKLKIPLVPFLYNAVQKEGG